MIKKFIFAQTILFLLLATVYFMLQNETIYTLTFGKISNNHVNNNDVRTMEHTPFSMVNNVSYIQWDAANYDKIKNYGYDVQKSGGDYIFAYFPLFPYMWRAIPMAPLGWLFINFLLYSAGLFLLLKLFTNVSSYQRYLTLFMALPILVVYLVPYTESLFFFLASVGIYGFMKRNYSIYFIGFMLASLTRPTFSILLIAFICTEFLFMLNHRRIKKSIKNTLFNILPLITGTFVVSIVQLLQGSGSLLKFAEVQVYWDHYLRLPNNWVDWSYESYGLNIAILVFVFLPVIFVLTRYLIKTICSKHQQPKEGSPEYYLTILSAIYLIGGCLFILLFQGGSLNNLYRYTANTPFFYLLIIAGWKWIEFDKRKLVITLVFALLAIVAIMAVTLLPYSHGWMYADYGLLGFMLFVALWIYQKYTNTLLHKSILILVILLNALWTSYLFNTYINNGWGCL